MEWVPPHIAHVEILTFLLDVTIGKSKDIHKTMKDALKKILYYKPTSTTSELVHEETNSFFAMILSESFSNDEALGSPHKTSLVKFWDYFIKHWWPCKAPRPTLLYLLLIPSHQFMPLPLPSPI
jgi:hypothetical protein